MELTGYTEDEVESLVTALSEALHNDLNEPGRHTGNTGGRGRHIPKGRP